MSAPVLSPAEIAQLQADKARQENFRDAMQAAIPAKTARAAELAVSDGAFKKFFDYYNDDIIAKYDSERKALNGEYIAAPITEADVVGPASINGAVRTTPVTPVTDIIRVPQFDGGPLIVDSVYEQLHITEQAQVEDTLANGYASGGGFNPATAVTASSLSPSSTTLDVEDPTNALTISVNDVFVVKSFGDLAIVKVTGVTDNMGGDPPYEFTYDIELLVPPSGTISAGADLDEFTGFTNGERTSKIASDSDFQPLMDYLIDQLELKISDRILRLNEQLAAQAANQDPDGVATLATATTNVNNSKTFLTNYLVTTIISDTGLTSLSTERGTRGSEITARLAEIVAAYTGQTENYFDRRYQVANDRANTARGTLRLQKATEQSVVELGNYASGAQDAIDAFDALLP
jgi:hypothetical protein